MQTKLEQQKKHQALLNNDIQRRLSNTKLSFNDMTVLADKEKNLIDAIVGLLDFDSSVIEGEVANISAQLLWNMRDSHEKINRLNSLIHILQTAIKTAESNNSLNAELEIGMLSALQSLAQEPLPIEYSVKEFAKLTSLHPHTVRARFHKGKLMGRKDSKGIYISATELEKFKPDSTEQ